jgi:hypothetical protein
MDFYDDHVDNGFNNRKKSGQSRGNNGQFLSEPPGAGFVGVGGGMQLQRNVSSKG